MVRNRVFLGIAVAVASLLLFVSLVVLLGVTSGQPASNSLSAFNSSSYQVGILVGAVVLALLTIAVATPNATRKLWPLFLGLLLAGLGSIVAMALTWSIGAAVTLPPDTASYGVIGGTIFTSIAFTVFGGPLWIAILGTLIALFARTLSKRDVSQKLPRDDVDG